MRPFNTLFFALSERLINSTGVELTQDELLRLWEFYNLFTGSVYSRLIMRGESNENLDRQFYADTRNPVMLAERLFLIGEKARVCWTKNCFVDSDDTSLESGLQQIQQSEAYQNYGIPSMIPFSDLKNAKTFLERFENH